MDNPPERNPVGESVGGSVGDTVGYSVGDPVGGAVGDAVGDTVGGDLAFQKLVPINSCRQKHPSTISTYCCKVNIHDRQHKI